MVNVLNEFVEILVGGISGIAGGIASGVKGYVTDLFLETSETGEIEGLSVFGGVVAIFGGIALA